MSRKVKTLFDKFSEKKKSDEIDINPYVPEKLDDFMVEDLVTEFLSAQKLQLFPENEMAQIVKTFVTKQEIHSITDFVDETLGRFYY